MRLAFGLFLASLINLGTALAQPPPGEADFAKVCGACHGPQGRGRGEAPALVPMNMETDQVLGIVREGFGQMPPVSSRELNDSQVLQIVEYLKTLSNTGSSSRPKSDVSSNEEAAVLATLTSMTDASLKRDIVALAKIYHDDLIYVDESGLSRTKTEQLKIAAAGSAIESSTFADATIRVYGSVALLNVIMRIPEHSDDKRNDLDADVLWILVKGPEGWQIVAHQATRIQSTTR